MFERDDAAGADVLFGFGELFLYDRAVLEDEIFEILLLEGKKRGRRFSPVGDDYASPLYYLEQEFVCLIL